MSVLAQTVLGMSKTVRIHVFTTLWPVGNVKPFQMLCDELELRPCFRPKCMASTAAMKSPTNLIISWLRALPFRSKLM
ncbi:hypothetical protein T4D_6620, partial [Trichinella pseudospiralis]